jgi:hypothetical protein
MITTKLQRFREAYLSVARHARYRPQAPSDRLGNVCLSKEEAADPDRLAQEATAYTIAFNKEEDDGTFTTLKLLSMALEDMRHAYQRPQKNTPKNTPNNTPNRAKLTTKMLLRQKHRKCR